MKRVSTTLLESFRRFSVNDYENYDTEKQLVESLTGEFKGTLMTTIGSAFHYLIEKHDDISVNEKTIFDKFGVTFAKDHYELALEHAKELGTFTPEIKLSKEYPTRFGNIQIVGKVDQLHGVKLRDTKVTFKPRTYDYYQDSIQWKIYLSIFDTDYFDYDVFEVQNYIEEMGLDVSKSTIVKTDPIELLRYDLMEKDIETLICSFTDWVDYRCLWDKLPEAK